MKKFLLVCFSFVFALSTAWAQERMVSGKVTSPEDGSTLPGVNVVPFNTTFTPGKVDPSSGDVTLPETIRSCAQTVLSAKTNEKHTSKNFFIGLGLG